MNTVLLNRLRSAFLASLSALFVVLGCSHVSRGRLPASDPAMHPLEQKASQIRSLFADPSGLSAGDCPRVLAGIYQELFELTPSAELLGTLGDRAGPTVHLFFEARQSLRSRLNQFHLQGELSVACVDQARNLMRALRFGEEYLAEAWIRPAPYDPKRPARYLSGPEPYLQVPEAKGHFSIDELRSGDLLMSRGNAITSAAIARMADVDGQFSHLAQLYIDPETRERWVLEAHIEVGTTVRPYEDYAGDGNFRVAVLRLRDPAQAELAHLAARAQFERLMEAKKRGSSVPYDFSMKLQDSSELFCSEVAFEGFNKASMGSFQIPLFQSQVNPRNRDFLDRLGIQERQTFMPSDLDVDPRFEVLAEWKDISRIGDVRRKDAVLDRFYHWSDRYDYRLGSDLGAWFKKTIIWQLRRWPVFSKLLQERFPLNMSRSVLQTVSVLTTFGENLLEEAERLDERALKSRGYPLTFREMAGALDAVREDDLLRYQKDRQWQARYAGGQRSYQPPRPTAPRFTHLFHP